MKKFLRFSLMFMMLGLLHGCAGTSQISRSPKPDISLEDAKTLIISGQVREIFQPHQGCVLLTLKDDRLVSFEQPYLDWVLHFVDAQGLSKDIMIGVE